MARIPSGAVAGRPNATVRVLPFRAPVAALDECVMCGVGLGEGLTLVARAKAPMDKHCLECAQWTEGAPS